MSMKRTSRPNTRNQNLKWFLRFALVAVLIFTATFAWAQAVGGMPSIKLDVGPASKDKDQVSASLQILAMLTILSVAPALLILTTAFTRIVIVLGFVRTALGTQNIPPTQVIVGLSLFLSLFVMAPTYQQINDQALQPYMRKENPISFDEAVKRAEKPLREFMLKNTYEGDLKMFVEMKPNGKQPKTREDVDLMTLIPAFVISELKTAFIIGFYIFVPFVIIDLIVASLMMGMGMMMMPPIVVSLPAKLLVFVLADGWSVLIRTLLSGYQ